MSEPPHVPWMWQDHFFLNRARSHEYLFVFHIAETILRTRIDRFREKGRTSSHIHLFPMSTNNPSYFKYKHKNKYKYKKRQTSSQLDLFYLFLQQLLTFSQPSVFYSTLFTLWIRKPFSAFQTDIRVPSSSFWQLFLRSCIEILIVCYKLQPYDSFWGEAIECTEYKYERQYIQIQIW